MGYKRLATIAVAAVFGAAAMIHYSNDNMYPPKNGENFLYMRGYTEIGAGTPAGRNACGENIFGRTYKAIAPTGNRAPQTICYGGLGLFMASLRP